MMLAKKVVCRCEEVTLDEIREAVAKGGKTLNAIKKRTGAGMGLCQGRNCQRLVAQILAEETGTPLAKIDTGTYRPPIMPIAIGILANNPEDVPK